MDVVAFELSFNMTVKVVEPHSFTTFSQLCPHEKVWAFFFFFLFFVFVLLLSLLVGSEKVWLKLHIVWP